ncbi:MAG: response regulator [Gemmataceae bacterium]
MTTPTSRKRVLLVEDIGDARRTLALVLSLSGFEVRTAPDGPSGLREALEWRPDVVLCDLGLPGIDGWEVARRLRAEMGSGLLLIAISGYATPEDVGRSLEAGFDTHIPKPPHPESLLNLLVNWPGPDQAKD